MIDISDAIKALAPGSDFAIINGDISKIDWISSDVKQPSQEAIEEKLKELQADFDAQEYARKREAEYPSIQECVHAILDDDLTALQEKRQAIKTKYPKS